jgi:uncharacterized membrane protein YdjX (TVP38/TMEM64 family)
MTLRRFLPAAILLGLIAAAFTLGLDRYLTLDALRDNRKVLLDTVSARPFVAGLVYMAVYATVVALSLPGALIMTLAGGFLFGVAAGSVLTAIGATTGATVLFVVARSALGDVLRRKAGPFLARMADGFERDAFSYLLFLRLVPAFPFWAVNLAPAMLGMRLTPFIAATGLGIIPGTIVFSAFGAGLGEIFDAGGEVSLKNVFSPPMLAGLFGLGVLALLPAGVRRWKARLH